MNTAVVIPAYNEEKTLRDVIHAVKKYVQNIIVVDDGSHDTTESIA
ncbi:glycosyltransferase, partial [Candidatus Woesearchaeota archaeon]|nr:glycosyltransferase [Candidatus Woesearchaeota archaeon]